MTDAATTQEPQDEWTTQDVEGQPGLVHLHLTRWQDLEPGVRRARVSTTISAGATEHERAQAEETLVTQMDRVWTTTQRPKRPQR